MTSGGARPVRRWHHASTMLDDFAVVTFRVEHEALRRRVPAEFIPRTFAFADGTSGALISVVAFVERDFAFRFAPFVRISGPLVDYRAYGSVGDEVGVYVFRTSLDHALVTVPRVLWKMPWVRERVDIDATWSGPGAMTTMHVSTDGDDGLELALGGGGGDVGALDGFVDADEAVRTLTHPLVGWYGPAEDLRRYSVWHEVLRPVAVSVERSRVPAFRELGLLDGREHAHSALVVRRARFDIHTPPTRVG